MTQGPVPPRAQGCGVSPGCSARPCRPPPPPPTAPGSLLPRVRPVMSSREGVTTLRRPRPLARPGPTLQAHHSPPGQPLPSALTPPCPCGSPWELSSPGPSCAGGRCPGGPCPGASGYSLCLDSSSSERSLGLLHSSGWASRSRCVHEAGCPGIWGCHSAAVPLCWGEGGRDGWRVVGPKQRRRGGGAAGGWAMQLRLPSGPAPPARPWSPQRPQHRGLLGAPSTRLSAFISDMALTVATSA